MRTRLVGAWVMATVVAAGGCQSPAQDVTGVADGPALTAAELVGFRADASTSW